MEQILKDLNEIFKELDTKVLNYTKDWVIQRKTAMYEFLNSHEAKSMGIRKYEKAFSLAGGKSWYNVINGNSQVYILEQAEKHCKIVSEKRNKSIANKLTKLDISEILSNEMSITTNGFNGIFIVNTNKGHQKITIETILVGGHNIQCLHLRVLVKIKPII